MHVQCTKIVSSQARSTAHCTMKITRI